MEQQIADLIVVGGGGAGLSAALHLARMRRRVVVLDGGEPRNRFAAHMHGLLGRDGASPLDLLADGRAELVRYGVEVRHGDAVGARRDPRGLVVVTADGVELAARRLLVATGLRDELPAIDGLAALWGRGVATCPYCDGWEVRDGSIGVLHDARGPHLAQLLRELSERVVYLTDAAPLAAEEERRLTARGIAIESRPLRRVVAREDRLVGGELGDGTVLALDALFLAPRLLPRDELLRALGAATEERTGTPWVTVDAAGRTSVPGVWAAGNVVDPFATVPLAIAAGAAAAIAINGELVEHDVADAVATAESRA